MDLQSPNCNKKWNRNVMNVILGKNACGSCLRFSDDLLHWDVAFVFKRDDLFVDCSLKNIMWMTFGSRICDMVSTTKFCQKCIDAILKSYLFIAEVQDNYKHIQIKLEEIAQQMKWTQNLDETGALKENITILNADIDDKNEIKVENHFKESTIQIEPPKIKRTIVLNNESLTSKLIKDPNMHKYLFKEEISKETRLPPGITVKKIKKSDETMDIAPHELLELKWADETDYETIIPNIQVTKNTLHSNEALIMNLMEKAKTVRNHIQYPGNYNYLETTLDTKFKLDINDTLTVNLIQKSDTSENGTDNNDIIPQDLLELKWPEDPSSTKGHVKIPVKKLNYKKVKVVTKHKISPPEDNYHDISPHELLELNWNEESDPMDLNPGQKHNIDLTKWLRDQGMSIIKTETFAGENKNVQNMDIENEILVNKSNDASGVVALAQNDNPKMNPEIKEVIVSKNGPHTAEKDDLHSQIDVKSEAVQALNLDAGNYLRCALCTQIFVKFEDYKSHYKTHGIVESAKCYKCKAQFPVIELLSEHLLSMHLENVSYCNECFALLNQDELADHMAVYHDKKVAVINVPSDKAKNKDLKVETCKKCKHAYRNLPNRPHVCIDIKCTECKTACIHEKYLSSYHRQIVRNKKRFKCCDCKYRYRTKEGIIIHANKFHLKHKPSPLRCKVCDIGFLLKGSLVKHINLYHTRCNTCRKVFESQTSMRRHKCTPLSVDDSICELCGQISGESNCKKHKESALAAENECAICQQSVPIKCNMSRHMQDIHNLYLRKDSETILYECAICEIDFKSIEEFSQHNQIHTSVHECHICAKIFKSKVLFETHFQKHLAPQCDLAKAFRCSICNEQLIDKYAWAHHMQSHTDYEKCSICSKYIGKESLNEHLDSHEVLEKRFVCPHCSLISNSHNQFEIHVNRFHLQNRPYQCDICKKRYYSKHMVTEHIKLHLRPEKCTVCDRKFARKSFLRVHMRKHANVKL